MSGRNGVRVRWVTSRELSITQKVAPELTSATNHEKNVRLLVIRVYNVTVTYATKKTTGEFILRWTFCMINLLIEGH